MKITVLAALAVALEKTHDTARISNSLNSAYHDGTKVDPKRSKEKVVGTRINEKDGQIEIRESTGTVRIGEATAPLRFYHWMTQLETFLKKSGTLSGDLSIGLIPNVHRTWLDNKFTKGRAKAQSATEKRIAAELVAATKAKAKAKLTPPVRANKPGKPGKASVDGDEQNSNGTPETVKA